MSSQVPAAATPVPARVMDTPRSIDVEITSQCNLRCRYCYYYDNSSVRYEDLPTEAWQRFFDECGRCAVMRVTLQGGEPFTRKDLPDLIDSIWRNRMRFSILSNGALIDDEMAALLARTGRCDYVQVSIDGSTANIHDACRGANAFDGALRGIRVLQRHGVNVTVRVTIHHHNVRDLEGIAHLLLEDLGLPGFSTNAVGYLGSCQQHAEVLLTTEERQMAMETLLRLAEAYDGRISAQAGPLAEARTWRQMKESRARGAPPSANGGYLTGCGCTSSKMAVRADGVLIPCTMLAHLDLGHINEDALTHVWQSSPLLNRLRRRRAIPLARFGFCAGCAYIPYCTGNCPGLAYALTGQVDHPSPEACLRRFLQDGGEIG